jgi:hypothetical protein
MQIIELPEDLARLLGENPARLSRAALEALAVVSQQSGAIPALRASIMCAQVWLSYMKEV